VLKLADAMDLAARSTILASSCRHRMTNTTTQHRMEGPVLEKDLKGTKFSTFRCECTECIHAYAAHA
jgi:hypothetical protein